MNSGQTEVRALSVAEAVHFLTVVSGLSEAEARAFIDRLPHRRTAEGLLQVQIEVQVQVQVHRVVRDQ